MTRVSRLTNLYRREGGSFFFMRRVPTALLPAFQPRKFIKITLGTKDLTEAKSLVRKIGAKVQAEFDQAEKRLARSAGPLPVVELDETALRGMVSKWLHESDAVSLRQRLDRLDEDDRDALIDILNDDEAMIAAGAAAASVDATATTPLTANGIALSPGGISRMVLLQLVEKAMVEMVRRDRGRVEGDLTFRAYDPNFAAIDPAKPIPVMPLTGNGSAASDGSDGFEALVDLWAAEKEPGERGLYEFKRTMKELAAFVGHDNPQAVTKADIVGWKNDLLAKGKTAKTVNDSRLAHVKAVFNWAVRNVKLADNPAAGVLVETGSKKRAKLKVRLPYTTEEAKLLLAEARKLPELTPRFPYRKWLVFLMAYTGCRINEAAQLMKADVQKDRATGIWHLDLNIEEVDVTDPSLVKSLKNAGSIRRVPLHPALIEEGFLDFCKTRPKVSRLFSDVAKDADANWGSTASKWYTRWVRGDLKILDPKKTNHSWRHRFKTICRGARIPRDVHQVLTGHAGRSEGDGYGGFPLDYLAEEIAKLPNQCGSAANTP